MFWGDRLGPAPRAGGAELLPSLPQKDTVCSPFERGSKMTSGSEKSLTILAVVMSKLGKR